MTPMQTLFVDLPPAFKKLGRGFGKFHKGEPVLPKHLPMLKAGDVILWETKSSQNALVVVKPAGEYVPGHNKIALFRYVLAPIEPLSFWAYEFGKPEYYGSFYFGVL
jgi:hypothetical protein